MKWKPYPEYKRLGVEWLGEVPANWRVKQLKRTFVILNGSTPRTAEPDYWDGEIRWATPDDLGALQGDTLETTRRMITREGYESCGTTLAPQGSLVLSTRAPIGHLALTGSPVCTNQGCRCLVFRAEDDARFFYYHLLSTKQVLESWGQGSTFKELSRDGLGGIRLTSPPVSEQRAIAGFLDRETGRIDALIEKKERQIELLQEKRSALISHTVTKGLNPNVRVKDSGIQWLGQIPAHWVLIRFKYAMVLQRGYDLPREQFIEGQYPVYASNGIIGFHNEYTTSGPSITVGRSGSVGEINYIQKDFWAHNTALYVKTFLGVMPRFGYYLLTALDVRYLSEGSAVGTLNRNYIHNLRIVLPGGSEQRIIAAFLDKEMIRIDTLMERIRESINTLREYRTALITAAVTGKIDVREEVA
ncbi:MAG: restriction endonuclease subunit S [Candidatus Eisenbacteria bacterium]